MVSTFMPFPPGERRKRIIKQEREKEGKETRWLNRYTNDFARYLHMLFWFFCRLAIHSYFSSLPPLLILYFASFS